MTVGLAKTFETLAQSTNEASVAVLRAALDSPHAVIRVRAVDTILARRDASAQVELVRRFHHFDEATQQRIAGECRTMGKAIRSAVLSRDAQLQENGCRLAVMQRDYELVPTLLKGLELLSGAPRELAAKTFADLVRLLAKDVTGVDGAGSHPIFHIRDRVLDALEESLRFFARRRHRAVVESYYLLAPTDRKLLEQVLKDPFHLAYRMFSEVLTTSDDLKTVELVLRFMTRPQVPAAILAAVSKRDDFQFVQRLLKLIADHSTPALMSNVRRIRSLSWVGQSIEKYDRWNALDESCQEAAVWLVMTSGIPKEDAYPLVQHFLMHGQTKARREAAAYLEQFGGSEANTVAWYALDDDDPVVQANLVRQLRKRGIPGALPRLIDALRSPHAEVRDAARESLPELTYTRFSQAFDMLEDDVKGSTAKLVRIVDPNALPQLTEAFESPVRSNRLRALAIAQAMNVVEEVEAGIFPLLEQEDHIVRAEAVSVLESSRSEASMEVLARALRDRNSLVRDTAARILMARQQEKQSLAGATGTG